MATRGFTSSQKEQIAAKIAGMDALLVEARNAYEADQLGAATLALDRLEDMKLTQFITLFPPIAMAEPRKDIPFSVVYETLAV